MSATLTVPKVAVGLGRQRAIGYLTLALGAFILLVFGVGSAGNAHTTLTFTPINISLSLIHI